MAEKLYRVTFEVEAQIVLDDAVIDAVDDEWRSALYDLVSVKDIVEHVAYNLLANRAKLSQLDGWADQPDDNARILWEDWPLIEAVEIGEL
jgi:hypothetical protein